ncbi:unnamed protein product [Clavelina lepadiformis]|uniref:Uncharacterized protein n=1 Tax=Clavelina lepadiformis TaxID=159417 RepID=A0ABP0FMY2_CLALP
MASPDNRFRELKRAYATKGVPTLINSTLCGPVPTDLRTGTGPRTGGWGPLPYKKPPSLTLCIKHALEEP